MCPTLINHNMPPRPPNRDIDVSLRSQSQSRIQPLARNQRQNSYHRAMSTSFGEVQDPMLWMTRTPVSTPNTARRPPVMFPSRRSQPSPSPSPSPYPTDAPAARGYLPPYQLSRGRHQDNRSPPIPLYRRFPTPGFTNHVGPIPSLYSDPSRPYSAIAYRTQRANPGTGGDDVLLPPRPATSSDVDLLVPRRPAVFPARRAAQEAYKGSSQSLAETEKETSSTAGSISGTTTQSAQHPNSQKQPRIILKNYKPKKVPNSSAGTKSSAAVQACHPGPDASLATPIKKATVQSQGARQEEGFDDDKTITDSSGDELALDFDQDTSNTKQPAEELSTNITKNGSSIQGCTVQTDLTHWEENKKTSRTTSANKPNQKCVAVNTTPQKRCYANASTQANESWSVSSATQTVFEGVGSNPKRQKTSDAKAIAAVIGQTQTMLEETVTPRSRLDEIIAVNQDVGEMVMSQLRASDASVLEELEASMLIRMVVDNEDMYEQVEKILGVTWGE
ncbi:hypothetical protein F5X99DRAFT_392332 [Biscogniauxia marginata]|nr:hypothetical protein F5X99DRAFT_392332 [Biscogniauxia marginata]